MFLALKEIKKEKLRSGLVITMIALIAYLIFILTSLALGLAQENTDAINSWGATRIAMSSDANVDMRQSFLTQNQVGHLSKRQALIGQTTVVAKSKGHKQVAAVFIGLKPKQFIAKNVKLSSGRRAKNTREVVADTAFAQDGYKLGDKISLNGSRQRFTIVGFTKNAKINIAPVVYGRLSAWRTLRGITPGGPVGSAIISQNASYRNKQSGTKTYNKQQVITKLPGYSAQNDTFVMMIAFLMVISLIIIAVFLYILTMQKLPNYAVLRVQGIPSRMLVGATISQSLILVIIGLVIATLLTVVTALAMPAVVPMAFALPTLTGVGVGLIVMSLLGSLIPVGSVLHVDPTSVIGGN